MKLRKRAWQGREVPLEPEQWTGLSSAAPSHAATVEQRELLARLQHAIREELTPHQRQIVVAIALNGVPDRRPELDRYVELELAGGDADAAVPGLRAHLAGCPACAEEHDSLRALVAAERRD